MWAWRKYVLFNTEAHKVVGLFLSLQALFMSIAKLVCLVDLTPKPQPLWE